MMAAACVVSLWFVSVAAAETPSVNRASRLYNEWQIERADAMVDALLESNPQTPAVQFLQARRDFLHGRYRQASQRLDQLLVNETSGSGWEDFSELVRSTEEVTRGYDRYESPKGRFEIFVPKGADQVLVPYAGEALDRAWEAIGQELGYRPETPIRVEVYPQTSTLAKVSGLTEQEIRTSGTIALCKYNRLMITSPKALLRGYDWVDTLIHEYVHLVINKKTRNAVPIWMHEGLAKFLEHRWRGPNAHRLPPSTERLLKQRVEADDLISFEQMHPSMAKLPSQEDAAVAFAEVYTVMEYLHNKVGEGAFKRLLEAVGPEGGAKAAFASVVGTSFSQFERDWRAYLRQREVPFEMSGETSWSRRLVFKDEASGEATTDLEELDQPQAQDHMRLGEMLHARGRYEAALVQYRKASRLSESPNPRLSSRLAFTLNKQDQPREAIETLSRVKALYPSYYPIWIEMGKAHLALDQPERARDAVLEAARINPFDPEVHRLLAEAYDGLGNTEAAERERRFASLVE
jgi:tetratricopeptide (TPR) repeat protein